MANINENRIDQQIPAETMAKISGALTTVRNCLPQNGSITLTPEQLASMLAMDVDNRIQLKKVITEMSGAGKGILPDYFNVEKINNDDVLFDQLGQIEGELLGVLQSVTYLKRLAAHEGVAAANAAYQMYKAAAAAGVPDAQGVYERLSERFAGQGANSKIENG